MTTNLMAVITPDGSGIVMQADSSLYALQALVGGYIEDIFPSTGNVLGWHGYVNEDGKGQGAPANPYATEIALRLGWTPLPGDYLVGTVVFLGDAGEGEGDLPLSVVEVMEAYYNEAEQADEEGVDSPPH